MAPAAGGAAFPPARLGILANGLADPPSARPAEKMADPPPEGPHDRPTPPTVVSNPRRSPTSPRRLDPPGDPTCGDRAAPAVAWQAPRTESRRSMETSESAKRVVRAFAKGTCRR